MLLKLRGFEVEVLCYDIKEHVGDANAKQVSLKELQQMLICIFLGHRKLIKWLMAFVDAFTKSFCLTSRGIM
jgi:D-3-phosphoglycerate dehydrogenase